jgi:hypothetical protein
MEEGRSELAISDLQQKEANLPTKILTNEEA